jgi:hypothetical protein
MYAADFHDFYPIVTVGAANSGGTPQYDQLGGEHYTRYIVGGNSTTTGSANSPASLGTNTRIPPNYELYDQNLGFLYGGGQCANPLVFFCPSLGNTNLEPGDYSNPIFISTDATAGGNCRSSYMFNPRMVDGSAKTPIKLRKYQKTTDARQMDVLLLDYLSAEGTTNPNGLGIPFNAQFWAHWPSQGMVTGFTDGHVKYEQFIPPLMSEIELKLETDELPVSAQEYDQILSYLQTAP